MSFLSSGDFIGTAITQLLCILISAFPTPEAFQYCLDFGLKRTLVYNITIWSAIASISG